QEKGVKNDWLFGTDLAEAHVALARKNTGLSTIKVADAASQQGIPFSTSFSVVLALNWVHVPPKKRALNDYYQQIVRNITTSLNPGGILVYDVPLTPTSAATRTQTLNILNQLLQDAQFAPLIQTEPLFVWQKR
ncbi:MAG: class I SAM-dependent methyltransferase, partial [bacterium]|nr:class I SAM-dependent methyltransferase [bacterium]